MDRKLIATDLAIQRRGDDCATRIDSREVVGRVITWLLDPTIRRQVNAVQVGQLVVHLGDDLTGTLKESVVVTLRPSG